MKLDNTAILAQLDELLNKFNTTYRQHPHDPNKRSQFTTMALSMINRIAGPESIYAEQATVSLTLIHPYPSETNPMRMGALAGILEGLRSDVADGYLVSLRELIHADVFSDFLEMAEYLQSEGYKDASAVLVGGTLEGHLRQLCQKHNVSTEEQTTKGPKPKKAETLNTDLAKANVYTKLEQKNITAWLDLRNKAAHGKYAEYSKEQVSLLLQGVRDFIIKYPA